MKRMETIILAGVIAIGLGTTLSTHLKADDSLSGEWRVSYSDARDYFRFEGRMRTATSNSNWSESNSLTEFRSRHVCDDQLGKRDVHCDVNREAGTVTLDGHFDGESGSGTFRFACKEDFRQRMAGFGYSELSLDE